MTFALEIRGGCRTAATSKVELFVIIYNRFQPLTIITKNSTLDAAAVLDPPLEMLQKDKSNFEPNYFELFLPSIVMSKYKYLSKGLQLTHFMSLFTFYTS